MREPMLARDARPLRGRPARIVGPVLMLVVALAAGAVQNAAAQSPGLVLSETNLAVTEGSSADYTVKLATQPSASVTVSIGGTSGTDLSLNKTSLTFTTMNYDTVQTVTVSAAQDDDATGDTATLTHSASGGGYDSVSADLPVTVADTTRMRVIIDLVSSVSEGESTPIRAMLPMPLDADVSITVTVTPNGGRADEYTLSTNRTLTITAGETASTGEVTFTSLDDSIYTGVRSFNVTLTPNHARVDAATESLFAVIDDDNTLTGLQVSPSTIFENGGKATLRADKLRLHDGVVKLSVSLDPSDRATLSGTTLTFQPGARYATETLTITAVDNDADEADQTITIAATVTEGRGVRNPSSLTLTIEDDENMAAELALVLAPPRVREGLASTVTAVASAPLTAAATITVSASPGHEDTRSDDYVLSANRVLTIPAGATRSSGTVTIGTVDDQLWDTRTRQVTVSGTVTGGGLTNPADQTLAILEDDSAVRVSLMATPATITEGGVSTITMRALEAVPADVTVTVTIDSEAAELSADPVLMIPEGETASTGEVTLTAVDDTDSYEEYITVLGRASSDSQFLRVSSADVFVIDDDAASALVWFSPAPHTVLEGGTSTIIAELTQPLSGDVTLTIGVDETNVSHTASADDYTMSTNRTLTIPAGSTSSQGVVTLTATNDAYYRPPSVRRVALEVDSVTGIDADKVIKHSNWLIREDENPPAVTLDVAPASISENGGRSTVTATLNEIVAADVEVTVTAAPVGTAEDGDFSLTGNTLSIAAGQKASTGTVTIGAVNDDVDGPDKNLVVRGTVRAVGMEESAIAWDPFAEGLTIRDDDESGLSVNPRALTIDEGGDGVYTVQLRTEPPGSVGVSITGASETDLTVSPESLTFTRATWNVARRVTVTAAHDDDALDDMELLTYTASRSEYGAFALPVTVRDDEGRGDSDDGGDSSRGLRFDRSVYRFDLPENRSGRGAPLILGTVLARDPDGDRIRYALLAGDADRFGVSAGSGEVSYIGGGEDYESGPRQFELQVTAIAGEKRARARVVVRVVDVPEAPLLKDDSAETLEDTPTVVDVLSNDRDPEGDRLRVVAVGPAEHGTAAMVSGGVRYLPDLNWYGTDRFSYTVAEPEGLTATATVTMTVLPVNDAPEAVGVIPDQALEEGGPAVAVDLTPYFFDVDGDVLTYTAESSDETAVTAAVVDSTLTLSAVVTGAATVTVTASDPDGLTATQAFGVRVGDRLVRAVLTDTLAALGRGHLSSVRSTIGRHLETGGGRTRLTVGGQFLSPDARDLMGAGGVEQSHELLFRAAQLRQRSSPTGMVGTSAHPPARAGMAGLMEPGPGGGWDRFLQGTDVLLSFGGQDEPAAAAARSSRWSVWSQGDLQSFRGAEAESQGYRGDLRTWYLGLDARLGENWLFGSAVARSDGGGDWQVGSSSGRLTTALTVVHPYARWTGRDTSVWALAGIGMGTAQNVRRLQPGRQGTSPLSLGLGLLEGRRRVATTSLGMAVDLQGEASWARLRTGDGTETVDGLDAGVRRVRTGVEVTLSLGPSGGVQVTPFGAVSTRHDGGAGQTGAGLEVAGGGRLSAGRVRVEAQARMLALHTATDYGEKGFSVTATVGAGRSEPGLAVSLRPRWGAPGHGAESLWQDQFRTYTYGHGRDDRAVDAQLSYGLRLSGGRLLVPFGGYSHTVVAGRRVQVGANLQPLGCVGGNPCGPLQVELLGESYSSPRRGTDHRVALFAILSLRGQ